MINQPKKALICGVSGQDGAYLAQLLLSKKYEVWGTSRDAEISQFLNLKKLEIKDQIHLESMALTDFRSVLQVLTKSDPSEVYNLAGQSSVGLSFHQPAETIYSISIGTLNLLEAIRFTEKPIKFYNAGSSECFGDTKGIPATESTPFRPRSPYALAKAAAFWQVANYREAYGLYACSGILFNHESPLRPERFVTRKITSAVKRIKEGSGERLRLGNIDIQRDWGWAPEYVEAMWLMLQEDKPDDFVVATGVSNTLRCFVSEAFGCFNLDWREYVEIDPTLKRPTDLMTGKANPDKAKRILGWRANTLMPEIAHEMVRQEDWIK